MFIAYGDVPSARDAIAHVGRLLHGGKHATELHPLLWRFDQLDAPRLREMALHDAATASALVFAMSAETDFRPSTDAWISALLDRMHGSSLTALALVGAEAWTITLAPLAETSGEQRGVAAEVREVFASAAPKRMAACAA